MDVLTRNAVVLAREADAKLMLRQQHAEYRLCRQVVWYAVRQ
jgi:predicted esterase YcpF (UPF0227 family)